MTEANEYTELQPEAIVMTAELLAERVEARFPGRGICRVAWNVRSAAAHAVGATTRVSRPVPWIRAFSVSLLLIMVAIVSKLLFHLRFTDASGWDMLEGIDAGISATIYLGLAVLFLVTLQQRMTRRSVLKSLQELRALAHVIDMHQLSKDPEWIIVSGGSPKNDPAQHLPPHDLARYLDYCSDMLAILGKVAALYAQNVQDGVVLAAVDEIETLSSSMSNKIWQKLIILDRSARQRMT